MNTVTLTLSTVEALQVLVAFNELMQRYEAHWALQDEDHQDGIAQEREWYNETLQKIASAASDSLQQNPDVENYIASQQTEDGQMVTVESIIAFMKGK